MHSAEWKMVGLWLRVEHKQNQWHPFDVSGGVTSACALMGVQRKATLMDTLTALKDHLIAHEYPGKLCKSVYRPFVRLWQLSTTQKLERWQELGFDSFQAWRKHDSKERRRRARCHRHRRSRSEALAAERV